MVSTDTSWLGLALMCSICPRPIIGLRRRLLLELFIRVYYERKPVCYLGLELPLVIVRLVAQHGLEDDVFGARGNIQVL